MEWILLEMINYSCTTDTDNWELIRYLGLEIEDLTGVLIKSKIIKGASTWENLSSGVWKQHRPRPASASGQSDQHLCYSLIGKYNTQTCYKLNFNFQASLCSWAGWFEFHFFVNPEDRFCHDEAQMSWKMYVQGFCRVSYHFSNEKYVACGILFLSHCDLDLWP